MRYLYYQKEDGSLWRVNIYSSSLTENLVAEVSSGLYKYVRKPFAVFTVDGSGEIHIVHNSNTFIEYDSLKEKRLYGLDDNNYLLLRVHGENQISLDIVVDGAYTRLSSDTDPNVYFDSRLEYVIYCSGNELCLWNGGTSQAKGSFGRITSVDIAGGDN